MANLPAPPQRICLARTAPLLAATLATALSCLAPAAQGHGDVHDRIVAVSKSLARDPGNVALLQQRAELHRIHEDFEAALADCDAAEKAAPNNPDPDLIRGRIHLDARRPEAAVECLTRFLVRRPDHTAALADRAQAWTRLGRPEDAAADYSQAIEQARTPDPDWFFQRGRLLAATAPPRYDEALRGIDQGIERLGSLVVLEELAAEVEARRGNTDAALDRLDRCASRSPRKEKWLVRRGEILLEAGKTVEARSEFTKARDAIGHLNPASRRTKAVGDLERRIDAGLGLASVPDRITRDPDASTTPPALSQAPALPIPENPSRP